jgi:membrane protease YdiL (CAAX protease family)
VAPPHHWIAPEPTTAPPPSAYLPHAQWRISDAVLAWVIGFVGALAAGFAIALVGFDIESTVAIVVVQLALVACAFAFLGWRSRVRGTGSLSADSGLTVQLRDWWAIPLAFVLQVGIGLLAALVAFVVLGEEAPMQGFGEVVAESTTVLDVLALALTAVVLAPLLEEVLFRGVLLRGLLRRTGTPVAIIVSAALFSLVHLEALDRTQLPILVDTFLWGVVLAWFALRRGSLSVPLLLHAGGNLLAVIALVAF